MIRHGVVLMPIDNVNHLLKYEIIAVHGAFGPFIEN